MHGENDTVVEFSQSKRMYNVLSKLRDDVKLVKLKDDDHYLRGSATRIQAIQELVAFVNSNIKP